jgi:hypothetical protein
MSEAGYQIYKFVYFYTPFSFLALMNFNICQVKLFK